MHILSDLSAASSAMMPLQNGGTRPLQSGLPGWQRASNSHSVIKSDGQGLYFGRHEAGEKSSPSSLPFFCLALQCADAPVAAIVFHECCGLPGTINECSDGFALVVAMFKQQPAARAQNARSIMQDGAYIGKAVCSSREGGDWFERQGGKVLVIDRDIRRIADDDVGTVLGKGCEPGSVDKSNVMNMMAACVGLGDGKGVCAVITGDDAGVRAVFGDGKRYGAAARAEIEYGCRAVHRKSLQSGFYQYFRIGAGDEGSRGNMQIEIVERLVAKDVSDGFAIGTAFGEVVESACCVGIQFAFTLKALCSRRQAGCVFDKKAQVEFGVVGWQLVKPLPSPFIYFHFFCSK